MTSLATQTAVQVDGGVVGAFVFYLALVVGIAVYAARNRTSDLGEFFLGGRRMGNLVVALSAVTSGRSAWLVLGVTGIAFVSGVGAVWAVVGYTVMELFLFLFAAPRLRRFTGRMDDITLPDFFASRFNTSSHALRQLTVGVIVVFMIAYVSAQFAAGGKAFASTFGMEETTGIWLTMLIVLLYTILGGYVAVALNDAIQAFFMLFGLVLLPVVVISQLGWGAVTDTVAGLDPSMFDPTALGIGGLIGFLGIGLGSPGNPHILVRYMSIDDPKKLRMSALWGTIWNVLMGWGAVFIGLAGRAVFTDEQALPGADTEQLFPALAAEFLPGVLVGFLVAAVFAAIMSTADSQLLVGASGVVRDIYQGIFRGGADISDRHLVRLSRATILVMCLIGVGLLYMPGAEDLVFWLVLFAWGGLGASFGPPVLFSIFWRGTTAAGVAAGIVVGAVTTVAWYYIPGLTDIIYEGVPGFIFSCIAVYLVSRTTTKPAGLDVIMEDLRSGQDAVTQPSRQAERQDRT
jgi:sodium/proline symporter